MKIVTSEVIDNLFHTALIHLYLYVWHTLFCIQLAVITTIEGSGTKIDEDRVVVIHREELYINGNLHREVSIQPQFNIAMSPSPYQLMPVSIRNIVQDRRHFWK